MRDLPTGWSIADHLRTELCLDALHFAVGTRGGKINIGGVIGLLPVSGIPLPFVSFGGSSLVVTMLASGMLANIGRASA